MDTPRYDELSSSLVLRQDDLALRDDLNVLELSTREATIVGFEACIRQ